jgi:CubicO group peptidase (beta-lactamase class C family)
MFDRNVIVAAVLGFAASFSFAQDRSAAAVAQPGVSTAPATVPTEVRDLSPLLDPIIKKHDVPGMVAGIVVGDRLVAAGAAGIRARGEPDRVTLDDQFHIGSCTKAMTATLCAVLVEKGTLRWQMTLAEAFPDLAERMHEQYQAVTLAQLLTNRGGVPSDLSADGLWGKLWNATGTSREARRMLLEGIVTREPAYPPGTKDLYSNAGFALAGHMAETVTGKDYEDLMQQHLFGPLQMDSCGWGPPGTPGRTDQPRGHRENGKSVEPNAGGSDNPPAITPAGRLHCTLEDWAKFISIHLRGDARNPGRECSLLKPETFEKLHTPPDTISEYAFGWARPIRPWARGAMPGATGHVLTHGGSNTMWFCVTWVAPERDFAVLVMCNDGRGGAKACDEAAWALIQEQLKSPTP